MSQSVPTGNSNAGKASGDADSAADRRCSTFATSSAAQNLVESKAGLFVAHGSEDNSMPIESFDLLVMSLLAAGRDVAIHRYPERDHRFISIGSEPGYEGFLEVIREVVRWSGQEAEDH